MLRSISPTRRAFQGDVTQQTNANRDNLPIARGPSPSCATVTSALEHGLLALIATRIKTGKETDMGFRCTMGFHSGTWIYTAGNSCGQQRNCERDDCTDVSYRTRHEALGPWELDNPRDRTSCEGSAVCRRCGEDVSSVEHEYDWAYVSDDHCEQVRMCVRCSDKETSDKTRIQHVWQDWQFNQSGGKSRLCRRCGDEQDK